MEIRYFMSRNEMSIDIRTQTGEKYVFYRVGMGQNKPTAILNIADQKEIENSQFIIETDENGKGLKKEHIIHKGFQALSFTTFGKYRKERASEGQILDVITKRQKEAENKKRFVNQIVEIKNKEKKTEEIKIEEKGIILTAEDNQNEVFGIFLIRKDNTPSKNPVETYVEQDKANTHCEKLNSKHKGSKVYKVISME